MKKLLLYIFVPVILTGCASQSGVATINSDTFMVSLGDATGFSDLNTLRADAFQQANTYCRSQHKIIHVVNTSESAPPYILGNFPRVKIQFMCIEKKDDE